MGRQEIRRGPWTIEFLSTYRRQVSSSDGQANGQGDSIFVIRPPGVAHTLDDKDQDECDQGLDEQSLTDSDQGIHSRHAQIPNQASGRSDLQVTRRNVNRVDSDGQEAGGSLFSSLERIKFRFNRGICI